MEAKDREGDLGFLLASRFPAAAFLFLSFLMWLSFSGLITEYANSNLSLLVRVGAGFGIIGLGVVVALVKGELDRLMLLGSGFCHAFVTYIIVITVAMVINVVNQTPMNVMSRGFSDTLWQCMLVGSAYFGVYMFGSKAVAYTLIAAVAAYGTAVLNAMARFGPATLIVDWLFLVIGKGRDTPATRALEIHTLIFGVGVFVFYYLLNFKTKKHAPLYLLGAFSVVMLGFKRSLIPGVMLCWVLYKVCHKLKEKYGAKTIRRLITVFNVGMLILSFAYLFFIRSGMLASFAKEFEIDTQGRVEMYAAVEEAYTISPSYLGKGLGWISRNMVALTGNEHSSPQLHCNFLEIYIEIGMWGYLAFFGYRLLVCPLLLGRRYGVDMCIFYFCIYLYSWITYFTDNTVFYWPNNLATWLCLFSEIVDQAENGLVSGISSVKKGRINESE